MGDVKLITGIVELAVDGIRLWRGEGTGEVVRMWSFGRREERGERGEKKKVNLLHTTKKQNEKTEKKGKENENEKRIGKRKSVIRYKEIACVSHGLAPSDAIS